MMWPMRRRCPVCRARVVETKIVPGVINLEDPKVFICQCGARYVKRRHWRGYWEKTCVDVKIELAREAIRSEVWILHKRADSFHQRLSVVESHQIAPEDAAKKVAEILARDAKL